MPVVDPVTWQNWSTQQLSGLQLAQLQIICTQVDQAVKDYLKRPLELTTYSNVIMAAPRTGQVQLFRYTPIQISSFQCFLNWQANGNPANFTSTSLLTPYIDYLLEPSNDDSTISTSGIVTLLWNQPWGVDYIQPVYSVAPKRVNVPGALMFNFTAGYTTIPADITLAACLIVSRVRMMWRWGLQSTSESWNGFSFSLPLSLMINGLFGDPTVAGLLGPYISFPSCIG